MNEAVNSQTNAPMDEQAIVQSFLRRRFAELQSQNPRYSLRAFANRAGVHSGALSAILQGKRSISRKLAERIAERLLLDPQERSEFLGGFRQRYTGRQKQGTDEVDSSYLELSASQFRVIGEWQHFAILSLIKTKGFKSDAEWIARRLGISVTVARDSIERMLQLGMLELSQQGELTRSAPKFRTSDDVADISIRKAHEQSLELAKQSLHVDDVSVRDHSSSTMAIDPSKIGIAKELIRKFQSELSALVESGNQTEVYRLSMHFFPLTKKCEGAGT
jgi:uncharacterized protein (TIGR02147 family)